MGVSASISRRRLPSLNDDWMKEARCADSDPDLFFPEQGGNPPTLARAICAMCPVKQECLDFSLREGMAYGIWGGHPERERRKMPGWTPPKQPREVLPCGDSGGAKRHRRRGEPVCEECLTAERHYTADYRKTHGRKGRGKAA